MCLLNQTIDVNKKRETDKIAVYVIDGIPWPSRSPDTRHKSKLPIALVTPGRVSPSVDTKDLLSSPSAAMLDARLPRGQTPHAQHPDCITYLAVNDDIIALIPKNAVQRTEHLWGMNGTNTRAI